MTSTVIQEFKKYKPSLLFLGLVNLFFKHINTKAVAKASDSSETAENTATNSDVWTETFATYIRNNDVQLMESCTKVLKDFEEELIPCEDWLEMFDVMGMLLSISLNPLNEIYYFS